MAKDSFFDSALTLPRPADSALAEDRMADWLKKLAAQERDEAAVLRDWSQGQAGDALLRAVFGCSPFLSDAIFADWQGFHDLLFLGPETRQRTLAVLLDDLSKEERDTARVARELRLARRQTALLIGLSDLTGLWDLEKVLAALTDFAEGALSTALCHILRLYASRGEIELSDEAAPEATCGFVLLGMGKLGARELNYSSDIDLIALFDPKRARYLGSRGPQEGFVKVIRDLVRVLEERKPEGYVFRTDFRLRPDPGAMPVALSFNAALSYYESLGQNWERAAMIKARPVAGDLDLGREFLKELRPFVWRKNLDFWALQDIHSIKRQIHASKGGARISVAGHNVKLGRGGIREIEFFAQTQQLIWGGRNPRLRTARTCEALDCLAEAGHVLPATAAELKAAYAYLRRLEHRLQMERDQQTHDIPESAAAVEAVAAFMGYGSREDFETELLKHLHVVEDHYAELFEEAPALSKGGNLVFTGGEAEPGTLATLASLGFEDGHRVFNLVRAWHHGRHRATRTTRSRQLLTELMPSLLEAFGHTTQPDVALTKFDEFLAGLPAGVQLFSMIHANPQILDLLADIMGGAPALAEHLSRNPGLLDSVLTPDFFQPLPDRAALEQEFSEHTALARDYQDFLDLSRRWANDRRFQVGVHILRQSCAFADSCRAMTDIAEILLNSFLARVEEEIAAKNGRIPGSRFAVIAMGKLGAQEMTVGSDLDLVFLYETSADTAYSDGKKSLDATQYFARLSQRFISALTAMTGEGRLYEIDTRLRPSGHSGPIAISLKGFKQYYEKSAWTWEFMALTRARVVAGPEDFRKAIAGDIQTILCQPRDDRKLLLDIAEMREKIEKERPARSMWSVKFLRGGLTDLEFMAQYLLLKHAADAPDILSGSTSEAFEKLVQQGILDRDTGEILIAATRLIRETQAMLRLTAGPAFDADQGTKSFKAALARAAGHENFDALREDLLETSARVYALYREMIEEPARQAAGEKGAGA